MTTALALSLTACGINASDQADSESSSIGSESSSESTDSLDFPIPVCVYNQAYQENFAVDSIDVLQSDPAECYVLLDGLDLAAVGVIPVLKARDNQVGCYTSVGTGEDWRDDFEQMRPFLVDQYWDEWPGEYFVSDPSGILPIMMLRIDQFSDAGCDWVEFDNMDWAQDDEAQDLFGYSVSPDEAAAYSNELCEYVHSLDMLCMAKNMRLDSNIFDGATFESSSSNLDWWDGTHLSEFLTERRLGLIVHYDESDCDDALSHYQSEYGLAVSFICEDSAIGGYRH